jgi:NAD(P)H-hydrate repair Nnr-like enzyme with NAD(P)H-hydrate dehydratase domain
MVCAAISDLFAALTESGYGDQRQAEAMYVQAKARLLTYAPFEIVQALLAFERAGAIVTNPEAQKAIAALVRGARDAARGEGHVVDADAIELLFEGPSARQSR